MAYYTNELAYSRYDFLISFSMDLFSILMGEKVEPRKRFIEEIYLSLADDFSPSR